jgi:hypothetical protein
MKDVVACDKRRRAGKQALTRRSPNGETRRGRLLDGDQTQAESGLAWALEHPDRLIDQAALTMGVQRSNQIEGLTS